MSTIAAMPSVPTGRGEVTPDELLAMPDGDHYELVDEILVERSMNLLAGRVETTLARILDLYCVENRTGWVISASCGYRCFSWKPRQVRRPDVSFIAGDRLPREAHWSEGYVTIPPDLAVEVTFPTNTVYELEEKVEEYLRAGVRLVWVIHPEAHAIQVIRNDGSGYRLRPGDELSGEDVVPGFRCPVAMLFPAALPIDAGIVPSETTAP